MEGPRVVLLIVLLLFIFLTPEQPARRFRPYEANLIEEQREAEADVLTNSSYGQLQPNTNSWLNLTGFRDADGYQWESLAIAQDLSRHQFESAWQGYDSADDLPIYRKVTGELRGKFTMIGSSTAAPVLNLTALDPKKEYLSGWFERNITEKDGEISMSLIDASTRLGGETTAINAELALSTDSSPGNGWQAKLQGVHLPFGVIIMSTVSSKFDSLPALPHFALDSTSFNLSRPVMNETMRNFWAKDLDDGADGLAFAPQCELIMWLLPLPYEFQDASVVEAANFIQRVEQELVKPEGAPIGQPPLLRYSAVVFSPDCGYILTAPLIVGPKIEAYWTLAQRLLFAFVLSLGMQIALLKRQMEKAATPSTRSRIAYQGIVIAALGDGLLLFALVALLMVDASVFLMVAAAAYLSCIHVAFLEVKFVFDLWTVQVGDPQRAQQQRQQRAVANPTPPSTSASATTPAAPPAPTSADASVGLPLPVTAPRPEGATPIIIPADQGDPVPATGEVLSPRASFAAIYSRFYFSLVLLMFFSLWATSWPRSLRSGYANLLVFCYFSFWWPQIYRNTMRNCRKALSWEYVFGTSILRAVPILYWYFEDRNILSIDTSPTTAAVLLGWLWLQVAILVSQYLLGPRLLVRDAWCPPAYDYHPILREDDIEAHGMSIGQVASASEAKDKDDTTRKVFDCAICMNEIDVPVLTKADNIGSKSSRGGGAAWFEQRNYMVTPCRHIFHAECLEGWMNLRLVCPVCREALPPL
jgi:transmembrane E3 ubiquitin-protein ligase